MILRNGSVQTHQHKEDKIAKSLDITPAVNEKKEVTVVEPPKDDQSQRDLDYSRENLYHLVERGRDALEGILDLAQQSQSPRAYEVAGQLIKTVTDTNRDLIDLQKKAKDLFKDDNVDSKTINNNLFVGNTSELTKLLGGTARDVPSGKKKL
jgi:hypothetical protein